MHMRGIFKKIGAICLITVLFTSIPVSCTSPTESLPSSPAEITDQLGRTVKVEATPQRIISLAPSHTETLYALGLADRLIAVTDYCNYPAEAEDKPSIGGFSTPNIEEVVALSPDLVLATVIHEVEVIPQLEGYGLTVVATDPKTIDEVIEAITLIGQVTGAEKEATSLLDDMQSRVKAVTDKTGELSEAQKPKVLYIVWHDPLKAAGSGTLHDELMRTAGGINVAGDVDGYAAISLEAVITADPDVMIAGVGMGTGEDLPYQFITTEPRLKDTPARKNKRVHSINVDLVGRPGPRIVDALEQFAEFIHPELFKGK
jgi:iron complex transport system substrate-binding protein